MVPVTDDPYAEPAGFVVQTFWPHRGGDGQFRGKEALPTLYRRTGHFTATARGHLPDPRFTGLDEGDVTSKGNLWQLVRVARPCPTRV